MPASWRTFTQAARHCSSKPYSRSNSASVSPRMIARIVPNSPFTTILPSYSQKYNGRGDWLISGSAFEALPSNDLEAPIRILRDARFFDDPVLGQAAEEVEAAYARFKTILRARIALKPLEPND